MDSPILQTPTTPKDERSAMYRQPYVADSSDPAYSVPTTPDMKASEPAREFLRLPHTCNCPLLIWLDHSIVHEIKPTFTPSDADIPDNYVSHTIQKQKYLPPVTWKNLIWNIQWISFLALTITPAVTIYGLFTVPYNRNTAIWA